MKKPPTPSVSANNSGWRLVALLSLAANVALAIWAWTAAKQPPAVPTQESIAAPVAPAASAKPKGPYAALGSYMAENNRVPDLGWTEAQFSEFLAGFRASYEGRGLPLDEDAKKLRDDISVRVQQMLSTEQPDPMEDYFKMLREKESVQRTASGLHYRVTNEGAGPTATASDVVVMSFAGRTPDGRDLPSLGRERVRIAVRDLLAGMAEGVQLLNVGAKALLYLPPALSFTEENWPAQVPPGMPIVFFVELHEIEAAK